MVPQRYDGGLHARIARGFAMHGHQPSSPTPDTIEFELTDFSAARAALDELPAGVRERATLEPGYWEHRRRPPQASDRALTGQALDWLMKLPPELRPRELCERFPRVANVIADAWADPASGARLFDRLLHDDRGGRRGFPPEIEEELRVLIEYRARLVR
jgi:hypothetical protein